MKKGGAGGHNWGVEENGEQSGTAAAPPATALQQNQQNPQETRQEGEDGANANASEEVAVSQQGPLSACPSFAPSCASEGLCL